MCVWLITGLFLFGIERERGQGETGKITKPGKRSPASHSSQLLLIGQKCLEAESIYFFEIIQCTINIGLKLVPLTLVCDRSSFPEVLNQTISTYCESPKSYAYTVKAKAATV